MPPIYKKQCIVLEKGAGMSPRSGRWSFDRWFYKTGLIHRTVLWCVYEAGIDMGAKRCTETWINLGLHHFDNSKESAKMACPFVFIVNRCGKFHGLLPILLLDLAARLCSCLCGEQGFCVNGIGVWTFFLIGKEGEERRVSPSSSSPSLVARSSA